jgi:hypothetical protein
VVIQGEARGILKKVLELQKRTGTLKKDKINSHFKYGFASAQGVNEYIKPLLAELGIVAQLQTVLENVTGNLVISSSTLTLIDPDDGSEMHFQGIGSGTDSGDKMAMKSACASSKYATIAALFAASGDDPELDPATDKPAPSTKPGSASVGVVKQPARTLQGEPVPGETIAAVVNSFEEITRNGKQPFKINTDQGIFQSFDRKVLERIKAGSIVIYRVGRWGNDVVEVKNKDEQLELPEAKPAEESVPF